MIEYFKKLSIIFLLCILGACICIPTFIALLIGACISPVIAFFTGVKITITKEEIIKND